MFLNYLKIVLRNVQRQKLYSLSVIGCLAIGLSIFFLAVTYSDFHFSFDSFHKDVDRTYTLIRSATSVHAGEVHRAAVPLPLMPLLVSQFPEIEDATRFIPTGRKTIRYRDRSFYEDNVWFVDANFLSFFSFKVVSMMSNGMLEEPNSVVITESIALKYFGDENPIGRILTLDTENVALYITGVTEDPPNNSSIAYDFLVSSSTAVDWLSDWDREGMAFLRLIAGVSADRLQEKFPSFASTYFPDSVGRSDRLYLLPMGDLHLHTEHVYGGGLKRTTATQFYIIIANAIILLLIICLNFMNLATAKYMNRAREVGLRKVVGAHRHQLIGQFLGESLFLSVLALPAAMALCEILRPAFLAMTGVETALPIWNNPWLVVMLLGITVVLGLISGSCPALFLSAFNAARILRKSALTGTGGIMARKILVTTQFTLTAVLLTVAMFTHKQFDFRIKSEIGYSCKNNVALPVFWNVEGKLQPLRQELLRHPRITSVAAQELPFDQFLLDHRLQETVRNSTLSSQAFTYMSIVSVVISCMGLLGLAFFTLERRTKEIGVRKVFGASVPKIVVMFIAEFVKLLLVAHCVAFPCVYYGSHLFLKWGLVQRTDIGASVFIASAVISFAAAIISVLFQTVKAGQTNPVETLRYE